MRHYDLGGSTAKRWINCTGSVMKSKEVEESQQRTRRAGRPKELQYEAATRGSKLHHELERALKDPEHVIDTGYDEESNIVVNDCLDYIRGQPGHVVMEWVEETFENSVDLGGTADYVSLSVVEGVRYLTVVDFKTGRVPVSAKENHQLLFYASLVIDHINEGLGRQQREYWYDYVKLVVYQGGAEEWVVDREGMELFKETRDKAVSSIRKNQVSLKTGPWCQYCPARDTCEALIKRSVQLARQDFLDVERDELLELIEIRPALQALLDSIPERILEEMQKGAEFLGWKAVRSFGHRAWTKPEEDVKVVLEGLGIPATKEVLKSAPEVLREYPDVHFEPGLIGRPDKGLKVVPEGYRGEQVFFDDFREDERHD